MTPKRIDLNADVGEEITDDSALLACVTSANVACGYHAGSPEIMASVCRLAAAHAVAIGAQVSYADRAGFGRRPVEVAGDVLQDQVAEQVAWLNAAAAQAGTRVHYLRPHGALYHRVLTDPAQAAAVLAGAPGLPVVTRPGMLADLARGEGREVVIEGFPDRQANDAGELLARHLPGAVITETEAIVANALRLAGEFQSLCLHGDTPGAVKHAQAVLRSLLAAGWQVAPWCEVGTGGK